jgi:hypothetical protein
VRRFRIAGGGGSAEAAHSVEMLLGELEVAARGMDVRAAARLIELGQRPVEW